MQNGFKPPTVCPPNELAKHFEIPAMRRVWSQGPRRTVAVTGCARGNTARSARGGRRAPTALVWVTIGTLAFVVVTGPPGPWAIPVPCAIRTRCWNRVGSTVPECTSWAGKAVLFPRGDSEILESDRGCLCLVRMGELCLHHASTSLGHGWAETARPKLLSAEQMRLVLEASLHLLVPGENSQLLRQCLERRNRTRRIARKRYGSEAPCDFKSSKSVSFGSRAQFGANLSRKAEAP